MMKNGDRVYVNVQVRNHDELAVARSLCSGPRAALLRCGLRQRPSCIAPNGDV